MAQTQDDHHIDKEPGQLDRIVIENEKTTYRIVSKSVREYHFIVPYDQAGEERVEVGQIFSIKDQNLTFLARVLNIEHSSNYDGHWDTTMKGTQFFDDDQIFNRVIAEPLGCVSPDGASEGPEPCPPNSRRWPAPRKRSSRSCAMSWVTSRSVT